jgi:hypothetical protein
MYMQGFEIRVPKGKYLMTCPVPSSVVLPAIPTALQAFIGLGVRIACSVKF